LPEDLQQRLYILWSGYATKKNNIARVPDLLKQRSTSEIERSAIARIVCINPSGCHLVDLLTTNDLLRIQQSHGRRDNVRTTKARGRRGKLSCVCKLATEIETAKEGEQFT